MIETGIPKLDEFLGGGIPKGRSIVYYIQPGVEGEIFGLQTIYNSLKKGKTGVFVVSSTIPDIIKGQYFGIFKADWTKEIKKSMLFRILRPGGIKLYIPKILVTGPFDSGKSTFVHALSTRAISVDRLGTTIALDHGHIDYKGFSADIFGTPGQERFDPIIKLLSGESMGVFLIVDSTNPTDFIRAKQMLEITKSYGLPYVIIANKQDLAGALVPEDIRTQFNLPLDVPIVPVVAKDKKGVFEAFEVLIEKITGGL